MEGNIYDTEGAVWKWAAHNNITGVRWKGTNKEKPDLSEQVGTQERKIAKWTLWGKEEYPWEATHEDKKLGTHALHWNLAGPMYEIVTHEWKNLGADIESTCTEVNYRKSTLRKS